MANHAQVYREDGIISFEELKKTLQKINEELFSNLLTFEEMENEVIVVLLSSDKMNGIEIWIETDESDEPFLSRQYIEIRHGHRLQFYWWLDHVLADQLALRLGGLHHDDGVGEMELGFSQGHPSFPEYINRNEYTRQWIEEDDEYLKEQLPEEVYRKIVKGEG